MLLSPCAPKAPQATPIAKNTAEIRVVFIMAGTERFKVDCSWLLTIRHYLMSMKRSISRVYGIDAR